MIILKLSKIEKEYLLETLENQINEHDKQGEFEEIKICRGLIEKVKEEE